MSLVCPALELTAKVSRLGQVTSSVFLWKLISGACWKQQEGLFLTALGSDWGCLGVCLAPRSALVINLQLVFKFSH